MEKRKEKILIVDDVELNRAILCELFAADYDILEAENGQEAVTLMEKNHQDIVIVLMDIVMPVMNGIQALEKMHAAGYLEKTPVFLITAEPSNEYISTGFRLGVVDVILKPFNPDTICQRVNNIIELYRHRYKLEELVQDQMKKIERQNEQLRESNLALIDTLSTIVEFRDCESGYHVRRIRVMTKILLEEMGRQNIKYWLPPKTIEDISVAAALHDIGKIAIPDYILNKPGKLTMSEFEIMKEHTLRGCEILDSIKSLKQNEEQYRYHYNICRWHHEKWDGNGYPDGLKGEQIPFYAQIVALADCYDALTSERCYKEAYSHKNAVQMLQEGECGAFNPELLECFINIAPDLSNLLKNHDRDSFNNFHYNYFQLEPEAQEKKDFGIMSQRLQKLLDLEREKQRVLFTMSDDIIFEHDVIKDVIVFSEQYKQIFGGELVIQGVSKNDVISKHIVPEDRAILERMGRKLTAENPSLEIEVRLLDKNQRIRWSRFHIYTLWDKENPQLMTICMGRIASIDDLKRESEHWKEQAERDGLTGLGNHRFAYRIMEQILNQPNKERAGIMFIDVDNFKEINDSYGHLFGDEVLRQVAITLTDHFRANDILCRIGGDEFLVIVRNIKEKEVVEKKAAEVCEAITRIGEELKMTVALSSSVGVSFYPDDGISSKVLLDRADQALYKAKKSGKNKHIIYEDGLEEQNFESQLTIKDSGE